MTDTPPATVTDTPPRAETIPPVPWSERVKSFIGDLARPFAIIATSGAAAWATVIIARQNHDGFAAGAIFIGAVYAGVGALYVGKAWENAQAAKQDANVKVAQATSTTP